MVKGEVSYRLKAGTECLINDKKSSVAVIVTHPWGPLGGNLHNNVVVAVTLRFAQLRVTTARFDFSGGFGRGHTQVLEVVEVAKLIQDKFPKAQQIILVGYSYGSLIAASAAADLPNCRACVSIAPPFGVMHWLLTFGSQYHVDRAASAGVQRLCILGDKDNFTSEQVFTKTLEKFPEDSTTAAIVKNVDHFFQHKEGRVLKVIEDWLISTFSLSNIEEIPTLR